MRVLGLMRQLIPAAALALYSAAPALGQSFEDGRAAAQQGDPATAIAIWTPLAEAGHPEAQYWLAESFWGGWWGGAQNLEQVAFWHLRAAEQGHAPSFVKLGHLYGLGHHFAQNESTAAEWFARAAEVGNSDGQYHLAFSYFYGRGTPLDPERAYSLWRQAATQGNEGARIRLCEDLGELCGEKRPPEQGGERRSSRP